MTPVNNCPICSKQTFKISYSDGIREFCGTQKDYHYSRYISKDGELYSETADIGKYHFYKTYEFPFFFIRNKDKKICDIEITLSPKITEEYLDKLLLFS